MSSLLGNNVLVGASGQKPYSIDNSVRFNPSDNAVLTRTWGASDSLTTWTVSCWVKRSGFGALQYIFTSDATASGVNGTKMIGVDFSSGDALDVGHDNGTILTTSQVFRDPSAWFHLCLAFDTTQSTDSDRVKLYINGEQVTAFSTANYPAEDSETGWPKAQAHYIGESRSGSYEFGGYIAEFYGIDGVQLTPESFGELDSDTNQWVPKKYVGSYGTNGFYQKYGDSSALGADSSGNDNTFTATNLVATDQMIDTPTNNFATWNPLWFRTGEVPTYSEGNLQIVPTSTSNQAVISTIGGLKSGKWYFEMYQKAISDRSFIGIVQATPPMSYIQSNTAVTSRLYEDDTGYKWSNGVDQGSYGATWTAGDIIGVALNIDDGELTYYKNNATQGVAYTDIASGMPSGGWTFFVENQSSSNTTISNFGQDSSFAGNKTAQNNADGNGKGDFYYSPPAGYLALCTDNLSTPEIKLPGENFNTVLYTGTGSELAVTGVGFQPDLTIIRARQLAYNNRAFDSVRGVTKELYTNTSGAEVTDTESLKSFDSDGFTLGDSSGVNPSSSSNMVSWNWYAPTSVSGSTVSSGTAKTYSGKANAGAGFSITKYEGNGTNYHWVPHSLGVTPELAIVRKYGASAAEQWPVLAWSFTSDIYQTFKLDNNAAQANAGSGGATNAVPNSTYVKFGLDDNVNSNGVDMIMYCFASIGGYSKVGSYTGNSSTDGSFIYTGFSPGFVILKTINGTGNWNTLDNKRDPYNVVKDYIYLNATDVNTPATSLDFLSNGFKLRINDSYWNDSSYEYLYIAFAESPFKYSNAR